MSMSGICAMIGNVMEYFKPGEYINENDVMYTILRNLFYCLTMFLSSKWPKFSANPSSSLFKVPWLRPRTLR